MAALTPTSIVTENLGSLTLKIVAVTIGSTSDTYTMYAGAPIVATWVEGIIGQTSTFVQSTGVITLTNASGTGAVNLFVLMRGA